MLAVRQDRERIAPKQLAEGQVSGGTGDPPADHAPEGGRVADPHRLRRLPEALGRDAGVAAVAGPHVRLG